MPTFEIKVERDSNNKIVCVRINHLWKKLGDQMRELEEFKRAMRCELRDNKESDREYDDGIQKLVYLVDKIITNADALSPAFRSARFTPF